MPEPLLVMLSEGTSGVGHALGVIPPVSRTFAPLWEVFRVSSDKLALCHLELTRKLQDLIKDVLRYSDEQLKTHKKVRAVYAALPVEGGFPVASRIPRLLGPRTSSPSCMCL